MITLLLLNAFAGFGWLSVAALAASLPAGYWLYREYAESLRQAFPGNTLHPHLDAFAALVAGLAAIVAGVLCLVVVVPLKALRLWNPAWQPARVR
jgi:hypothetical protein